MSVDPPVSVMTTPATSLSCTVTSTSAIDITAYCASVEAGLIVLVIRSISMPARKFSERIVDCGDRNHLGDIPVCIADDQLRR